MPRLVSMVAIFIFGPFLGIVESGGIGIYIRNADVLPGPAFGVRQFIAAFCIETIQNVDSTSPASDNRPKAAKRRESGNELPHSKLPCRRTIVQARIGQVHRPISGNQRHRPQRARILQRLVDLHVAQVDPHGEVERGHSTVTAVGT